MITMARRRAPEWIPASAETAVSAETYDVVGIKTPWWLRGYRIAPLSTMLVPTSPHG